MFWIYYQNIPLYIVKNLSINFTKSTQFLHNYYTITLYNMNCKQGKTKAQSVAVNKQGKEQENEQERNSDH